MRNRLRPFSELPLDQYLTVCERVRELTREVVKDAFKLQRNCRKSTPLTEKVAKVADLNVYETICKYQRHDEPKKQGCLIAGRQPKDGLQTLRR